MQCLLMPSSPLPAALHVYPRRSPLQQSDLSHQAAAFTRHRTDCAGLLALSNSYHRHLRIHNQQPRINLYKQQCSQSEAQLPSSELPCSQSNLPSQRPDSLFKAGLTTRMSLVGSVSLLRMLNSCSIILTYTVLPLLPDHFTNPKNVR